MSDVLIRNVAGEDLERIRAAAAERGTSLQNYLRDTVHAQAAYLRRQDALARTGQRLRERAPVPPDERDAVLDAIDAAHAERTDRLTEPRR